MFTPAVISASQIGLIILWHYSRIAREKDMVLTDTWTRFLAEIFFEAHCVLSCNVGCTVGNGVAAPETPLILVIPALDSFTSSLVRQLGPLTT